MECRYEFCVYNRKNECTLEKISINEAGMCETCITVSIEKKLLAKEKEKQRIRLA